MKLSDKMAEHRERGCCSLESADWEGQVSQLESENERLKATLVEVRSECEKEAEKHSEWTPLYGQAVALIGIVDKAGV